MNFKRIIAIAKKEFLQIIRDKRSLSLALFIPMLLIVLFGFALTLDVDHVPMVIWDQDNSQVAKDFILNFKNSRYFDISYYADNYADMEHLLDRGKVMMFMVVPKDFSQELRAGKEATLQLIADGSDSNTATIAMGYVRSVVSRYNINLLTQVLESKGIRPTTPISIKPRVWFNEDLLNKNYVVPGLIALIMMIIAGLLTSLTVAREWERGTMEQLIATPVKANEIIIGKFIPYFAIGLIDLVITVFMARRVFMVPMRGSLMFLWGMSAIFLTGALGLGIYISTVARTQLLASQMAILTTFVPTLLLSGFTYPIYNMPHFVQMVTYLIPARYFITILRGIFLKGNTIVELWGEALCMFIFSILMMFLAIRKFKKKII